MSSQSEESVSAPCDLPLPAPSTRGLHPIASFLAFQLFWFAAVCGAAAGLLWPGPLALLPLVLLHLALRPRNERARELALVAGIGLAGTVLDTGLHLAGWTSYPGTEAVWSYALVPPWITALWIGFATQRNTSLVWLRGRPLAAALLGALGGPLSWRAGVELGAAGVGTPPVATWIALAVEYGIAMPLLVGAFGAGKARTDLRGPAAV